ncbi:dihydroorotase [Candidatus Bathyarchaeota archaeon]|nr:dihydroorotase [Candidatus Bathyarchaeota archaeon]
MTFDLVISGGVICTGRGRYKADLGIADDRIAVIGNDLLNASTDRRIDASGKILIPGAIDTHAHFRDPGFTHKEDFETGTRAAAAGGITMAMDMPNVQPPTNTLDRFKAHIEDAGRKSLVDFGHNAAGTVPEEIPKIAEAGATAFKIFMIKDVGRDYPHMPGIGIDDHGSLLELLVTIAKTGKVCMIHPHDQEIWEYITKQFWSQGQRNHLAYAKATAYYNSIVVNTAISTIILMQKETKVKLHILHVSTVESWEMIRQAKERGQHVTTEVNPAALFLSNQWTTIEKLGPYALGRWIPDHDGIASWNAVLNGNCDLIGSDHAPHTREEKEMGWEDMWKAPGGRPQIQDYLSLCLDEVSRGKISLERVVQVCSETPAKIFGLYPRKGSIQLGSDADLVIVDPKAKKVIKNERVYSKCRWTPYDGKEVQGIPVATILRGQVIMEEGEVLAKPGYGKFVSNAKEV